MSDSSEENKVQHGLPKLKQAAQEILNSEPVQNFRRELMKSESLQNLRKHLHLDQNDKDDFYKRQEAESDNEQQQKKLNTEDSNPQAIMARQNSGHNSRPYIGKKEEAPLYHQFNPYIVSGYRIGYGTWGQTICSLFQCHNETVNVWSHFIGFWVALSGFFALIVNYQSAGDFYLAHNKGIQSKMLRSIVNLADLDGYDYGYLHSQKADFDMFVISMKQMIDHAWVQNPSPEMVEEMASEYTEASLRSELVTKWPLVAYLLTVLFCLGLSTACHLLYVRNERVCKLVSHLDYWGIALLLLGSCYPIISYKYACGPFIVWRYIFTTIISLLTGVCMWASVAKSVAAHESRRVFLFGLFLTSCMVPIAILYLWHDPKYSLKPNMMPYMTPIAYLAAGVFFYVLRLPERWSTSGKFDLLGASHQWFHIFVLLAIGTTFQANMDLYKERLAFECPH